MIYASDGSNNDENISVTKKTLPEIKETTNIIFGNEFSS